MELDDVIWTIVAKRSLLDLKCFLVMEDSTGVSHINRRHKAQQRCLSTLVSFLLRIS